VVAGYGAGLNKRHTRERVDEVIDILPAQLHNSIKSRLAMSLSGGERQMLALSRALMCNPRLIVVDEPSMGLAPIMVDKVYDVLGQLHSRGVTVVVIEQIATHAVERADVMHLLSRGKIAYSGPASGDAALEAIRSSYVGHSEPHVLDMHGGG
jgi:branched-chain amino acid transport system ATP-binding protein